MSANMVLKCIHENFAIQNFPYMDICILYHLRLCFLSFSFFLCPFSSLTPQLQLATVDVIWIECVGLLFSLLLWMFWFNSHQANSSVVSYIYFEWSAWYISVFIYLAELWVFLCVSILKNRWKTFQFTFTFLCIVYRIKDVMNVSRRSKRGERYASALFLSHTHTHTHSFAHGTSIEF